MIKGSSKRNFILGIRFSCSTQGPFFVVDAATHGAVTLRDDDGNTFKVNGHRLKVFHEHEPLEKEVDMIEFESDIKS